MTEIMPVPRNLILLSYQQRAFGGLLYFPGKRAYNRSMFAVHDRDEEKER